MSEKKCWVLGGEIRGEVLFGIFLYLGFLARSRVQSAQDRGGRGWQEPTHPGRSFFGVENMADVTIDCRENGPLLVAGPVTIRDHLGETFEIPANKPAVALCRCGQSARRPFCDGAHKAAGFIACEKAKMSE